MQPARRLDQDWEQTASPVTATGNPALPEYEARRCHVCRCKYPSFGFGAPLAKMGQTIWACTEHRAAVDRMLTSKPALHKKLEQTRLL